ncbi:hypothetical protein [Peribacillus butanolivorans]|uniref:hypothetical protein n=1 Tax=Peribacillus butanolivorans TaxID=421767 RepID=UPI003649D1C5
MDQDTKMIQELQVLKQKVGHLEDLLTEQANKKEKVGPVRTFIDAIVSLLFGLIVVGPVVVVVVGVLMVVASWLGTEF